MKGSATVIKLYINDDLRAMDLYRFLPVHAVLSSLRSLHFLGALKIQTLTTGARVLFKRPLGCYTTYIYAECRLKTFSLLRREKNLLLLISSSIYRLESYFLQNWQIKKRNNNNFLFLIYNNYCQWRYC